MDVKWALIILHFVAVVLGFALDSVIYNYKCFLCSSDLYWFQFVNSEIFGIHLVIFFVVIAFFLKEEIPKILQLVISFMASLSYGVTSAAFFYFYFGDYQTVRVLMGIIFGAILTVIHLTVVFVVLLKT